MGAVGVLEETCPPPARLPRGAYYALTVLTALNVINLWHRYLMTNLSSVSVESCEVCDDVPFVPLCYIEEETSTSEEDCLQCRYSYSTEFYNLKDGACIDNSQYATLAGVGFTIAFAIATLFAGRLTDTLNRRLLHTGAILVWSLAAAAHGMCTSFDCLMVFRVILGVGEAFNAPACYALITLYFPHSRRATANGIYSTGTYLGSALSSLSLALAVVVGWRNTAFLAGAFGVLAGAVLFFTVDHHPVMPPTAAGYTRLADDPPAPPSPSGEKLSTLPPGAAAAGDTGGVHGAAAGNVDGRGLGHRSISLQPSMLSLEAGTKAKGDGVGSPSSASSTSSASSYEYYHGGGGASPGGALGSSGSGGGGDELGLEHGGDGDGRRKKRDVGSGGGGGGGSPFENPFSADSARAEVEAEGGAGGESRPPGLAAAAAAGREHEEENGAKERRGDRKKRRRRRRGRDHHPSPDRPTAAGDAAGEELRTYPTAAAGADTGAGVDLVAPYSSALQAAGATPNGGGWGWYDVDPAAGGGGLPGARRLGTPGGDGGGGGDGAGGGSGSGVRGGEGLRKNDLFQALRMIVSNRVVLLLFAASSARMIATWATAMYMPIYYRREYPSLTSLYSVLNAGFVSVGGMASSYAGGILSDRLRVRNEGVLGYIPALGCLAAIPPVAVVLFARSFYVSIFMLFLTYLVGECWLGPGMACLQMELPKEIAGTSVSILLFLNSVVCNVGTWFIGKTDPGLATVRRPLFAVLFLSYASSFCLFGLLGLMVSNKHQRRKNSVACLLSLHGGAGAGGDDGDALESGIGDHTRKDYGGVGGAGAAGGGRADGGGRRAPSMCEMVRRTLSMSGGASQTSSFRDFGDFGDFRGMGHGGGGGFEDDSERVAFLDDHRRSGGGGGGGEDGHGNGPRGAAARRPLLPRGRSSTRGDDGAAGERGGGRRKRGGVTNAAAAATSAAATEVDYGGGGNVSSTKMR